MTPPVDPAAVKADDELIDAVIAGRAPDADDLANQLAAWVAE